MPEVLMSRDGHVATITLNRPDRLNAISGPMLADLARMLVDCDRDREVRAVVLTGAGRGFCSGLDLQDVSAGQGIGSGDGGGTGGFRLEDTPPFVLRRLDLLRVPGKTQPMAVYELMAEAPGDAAALAERLAFLVSEPEAWVGFPRAARARYVNVFAEAASAAGMVACFRGVLEGGAPLDQASGRLPKRPSR